MLDLAEIPALEKKLLKQGVCALEIEILPAAKSADEAWKYLPTDGTGVIVFADKVVRFNPKDASDLLLEAEVCQGDSTVIVRSSGLKWRAWRWTENEGHSHRWIEYSFLSSEPSKSHVKPSRIIYRQYWEKKDSDGVKVWQPLGSRFCGFKEEH